MATESKKTIIPVQSLLEIYTKFREELTRRGTKTDLEFGIPKMDDVLWGIQRKQLTILAGRPSHGKTSIALKSAYHNANRGKRVWFFSLDMADTMVVSRLITYVEHIDSDTMKRGKFTKEEYTRIVSFENMAANMPNLFVSDKIGYQTNHIADLLADTTKPPDLVIIDYIQRLSFYGIKKNEAIEEYLKNISDLSRKYNFAAMVLSQINRQAETMGGPAGYMLKASGAIEEISDTVLLCNFKRRWEKDQPFLGFEIKVDKQRHGETCDIQLYYDAPYYDVRDMTEQEKIILKRLESPDGSKKNTGGNRSVRNDGSGKSYQDIY